LPPSNARWKAITICLVSLSGALLFGLVLALASWSPITVERAARSFIERQIEQQVTAKIGGVQGRLDGTRLGRLAQALSAQHMRETAALRAQLGRELKPRIAATVKRLQDPQCPCRAVLLNSLALSSHLHIPEMERAAPQLQRLILGEYGAIVGDLLHDLRIFAATNLLAFLALLALSALKPQHIGALFLPAVMLCVATMMSSAFYLFGQNWFFTILYADYTGYAYALWLLLIFGLLCDIALLKARITRGILHLLSSIVAVIPC
jgi:hypothetical protein